MPDKKKPLVQPNNNDQVASSLGILLANTYLLYVKTQNFHWNIEDPRFFSLHKMFEEQYEELAEAVDEIAERIRMIGHKSPASMAQFLKLATLQENTEILDGDDMINMLLNDHESIIFYLQEKIEEALQFNDQGSADLMIERLRAHEKTAWMLRSHFMT